MIDGFFAEDFEKYLNGTFVMGNGESESVDLKLTRVKDLGSNPKHVQFSVIFLAPVTAPLCQGIYHIQHDHLGSMDLFLVPVSKDANGVEFEAIFNRAD